MRTRSRVFGAVAVMVVAGAVSVASGGGGPQLDSITPASQPVHAMITLRGQGFGLYVPDVCRVRFQSQDDPAVVVEAGMPYVWRDDFIQVRVPVGQRIGGASQLIPKTPLDVFVVGPGGTSAARPFQVTTASASALAFVERSDVVAGHDVSEFLGSPDLNLARTKDADVGDVDGDGYPDLIDSNSNNVTNLTHSVLRTNLGGIGFTAAPWEPLAPGEKGPFVTTIPPGGDHVGDAVSYDSDFVDLDNDGLLDWVQVATLGPPRARVALNNYMGVPGQFIEDSAAWFPDAVFDANPDDIAHTDVNHDGFVDIAIAFRLTPTSNVYLNQAGQQFSDPITITGSGSVHDVIFLDADHDGFADIVQLNEFGDCRLFMHDGSPAPQYTAAATIPSIGRTAVTADLNGDGFDDFALAHSADSAAVFLNDPDRPGTFTEVPLPEAVAGLYDIEAGDIDLDGDVDLVGAAIIQGANANGAVRIWTNEGDGSFENATSPGALALLPGLAAVQRLSADLIDFDLDGDLDLYLTGADFIGTQGFGDVPNQIFENLVAEPDDVPGDVNGDGVVNVSDLVAVILAWGPCPPPPAACPEDLDGDGRVAVTDLVVVITNWTGGG